MELPTNSEEPDSSTASTSSGATADTHTTISPQSISPAPSTLSKQSPTPITDYQISPLPSTLSKQSCCCQQCHETIKSPRTEYHPASAKNIMNLLLPPRPAYKLPIVDSYLEGLNFMQNNHFVLERSVSMSDVGGVARERLSKHYALDD